MDPKQTFTPSKSAKLRHTRKYHQHQSSHHGTGTRLRVIRAAQLKNLPANLSSTINKRNVKQRIEPKQNSIQLKSIENKFISKRPTPVEENRVEMCSHFGTVCCETQCCAPSTTIVQCIEPSNICLPQSCCEEILYCTDSTPCVTENRIQTITVVQQQQPQQYICIDSCPSTVVNQAPIICTVPPTSTPQKYLCIQQNNSVHVQPQQQQSSQYLHISSASPQIIQTVSVPSGGTGQLQLGLNHTSNISRINQGPSLFQSALVNSVSKAAGVPFVGRSNANIIQLASSAPSPSLIPIDHLTKSAQNPIVPVTPGAQLIPFKPASESEDAKSASLFSPARDSPQGVTNFDRIQQQIQRRAQLLETYKRLAKTRLQSETSSPINKPDRSQLPIFSSTIARSPSAKDSTMSDLQLTRPLFSSPQKTNSKKSSSSSSSSKSSSSSSSSSAKPQTSIQTAYSRPYSVLSNAGSRTSQPTNNYGKL